MYITYYIHIIIYNVYVIYMKVLIVGIYDETPLK